MKRVRAVTCHLRKSPTTLQGSPRDLGRRVGCGIRAQVEADLTLLRVDGPRPLAMMRVGG
jgi:hypothetical protein